MIPFYVTIKYLPIKSFEFELSFFQNDVFNELNSSSAFVSCNNGWKLASSGMPPESKKRKVEMTYEISNGMGFDNKMDTVSRKCDYR